LQSVVWAILGALFIDPVIRLALVIPTLDRSGAEKQLTMLATRLPRDRFEVHVVLLTRGGPYESVLREAGIPVHLIGKRWRFDPTAIWRLRSWIEKFQPNLVHSWLFAANSATRLALPKATRAKVIVSERCVDSWKSGWQLWLDRRLWSKTGRLIANSQSVAEFYVEQGLTRDRIVVIPNGVEVPPAPTTSRESRLREWGLPEDARIAMYAGRLAKQKRLKDLIWAAQLVRQKDPRFRFVILGDGPERSELQQYARDVEVSQYVRFLGHRADAASLLHDCDLFWLASDFEGMSNSLMEAMACGKPCVVSDIPPNRELVVHDGTGYRINVGDSIGYAQFTSRLLDDQDLARSLGEAGRVRMATEFSVERMVERHVALYESVAGG
jgi:glycosyltransferase involved in cell wall biosynthesis